MSKRKYTIEREDLKLDDIKVGQEFSSYNELCYTIGIEPKQGGNSKVSQVKEIKKHIDFENIGRKKIIIKDIYIIEKTKIDARKDGNNNVYREDFLSIIIVLLRNEHRNKNKNYKLIARARLIEELGLVNNNYKKGKNNPLETAKQLNIPEQNLLDFFMISDTRMIASVESNLNFFEDRSYFNVDRVTAVRLKNKPFPRIATHDEIELIESCKNKVKKDMGLESSAEIFYRNLWKVYNEKVTEELRKRGSNILYSYKAYDFGFDREKIEELYLDKVKGRNTTFTKSRKSVNKNSRKSATESISRRQSNALERVESGKNKKYANKRDNMLLDENFEKNSKKMVSKLLHIDAEQLVFPDLEKDVCTFENYIDKNDDKFPF